MGSSRRLRQPATRCRSGIDPQASGVSDNDFSGPIDYIVTANDGSAKTYTVTVSAAPLAPTGLATSNVTNTSIDLSWIDNAVNEDGLEIERSIDGGAFVNVQSVGTDTTLYSDIGLVPTTPHTYRVWAHTSDASAAWSNEASATTGVVAQRARLLASDGAAEDYFGWSVGVSGDHAVIGAYKDADNGDYGGSAYVFEK